MTNTQPKELEHISSRLPTPTVWKFPGSQAGFYYSALAYIAAQVLHGRGEISYVAGEGLIYYLKLEPHDRERYNWDDADEIWIVLDFDQED